ncbi:MAG TPA: methyltransferase domain-containing protein [Bryobacteraceae bacterium]|nr:methyltransferase domain-containing protein [Bryobacteraceae bacterium]
MGPAADDPAAIRAEELAAVIREVRDRVRTRYPQSTAGPVSVPLADLMPLVHARDSAQAKVAAIGSVNPRRGGPLNGLVQAIKKLTARALDWHVREQVEFNRNTVACVEAAIEALNDTNRALVEMGRQIGEQIGELRRIEDEARQLADIRHHWVEWRADWEQKLALNEVQFLRSVADLQGAFQHRTTLMESNFRDTVRGQHAEFTAALDTRANGMQERFWADMEKVRLEYERLIHAELRVLRQRSAAGSAGSGSEAPAGTAPAPGRAAYDALAFAARFRGSEEYVREKQRFYLPYFAGREQVLDIGCGRGEFLELMREAGVPARGIDLDPEALALCRGKGLAAEQANLFEYLEGLAEASLDGIFCAQVVEHLPPERLPDFVRLAASRLVREGVLAIETPNPECLAIFATHFFLDPTHTRPVPHPLMAFYLEESGMGRIEVHKLSPAVESMPDLAALPAGLRDAFFGGLDYAVIARRL